MAAEATIPKQSAPRRRWPPAEKRRLVELTLRSGVSVGAIAREHGVHPTSLSHWKTLYRAGKLDAQAQSQSASTPRIDSPAASATFLPVSLVRTVRRPQQPATRLSARARGSSVVQLVLASGATLRIETDALDAVLVCALVAELRR
jgi:transposase-like protein